MMVAAVTAPSSRQASSVVASGWPMLSNGGATGSQVMAEAID